MIIDAAFVPIPPILCAVVVASEHMPFVVAGWSKVYGCTKGSWRIRMVARCAWWSKVSAISFEM